MNPEPNEPALNPASLRALFKALRRARTPIAMRGHDWQFKPASGGCVCPLAEIDAALAAATALPPAVATYPPDCPHCRGKGSLPSGDPSEPETCVHCDGTGEWGDGMGKGIKYFPPPAAPDFTEPIAHPELLESARDQGWHAHQAGVLRTSNPYLATAPLQQAAWRKGWDDSVSLWAAEDDQPLPEDEAIQAVHPVNVDGREVHEVYQEAMRLVGARRSKYGLVNIVHWLLWKSRPVKAPECPECGGHRSCPHCGDGSLVDGEEAAS